jgi:heme-degrading monooxygenase HmoA
VVAFELGSLALGAQNPPSPAILRQAFGLLKGDIYMFARILAFEVKLEKKEEFVRVVKSEILPILKKQVGFLEVLPLFPEKTTDEKVMTISLWAARADAERYEREVYPKVYDLLKPYLATPITVKPYVVETRLCEHFVEALAA